MVEPTFLHFEAQQSTQRRGRAESTRHVAALAFSIKPDMTSL
jgi:hypothetical protein